IAGGSKIHITAMARLISALIVFGTMSVSLLVLFVGANPAGPTVIRGFQGRYMIPVAPVLFISLLRKTPKPFPTNLVGTGLILFVCITTSVAASTMVSRYYSGETASYHLDGKSISPEGEFLVLTGWALDRNASDLASGVEIEIDGRSYPARYGLERPDAV